MACIVILFIKLLLFSLFQIEFYFSDSNLYRDNFLHDKVKANSEGFVDIALLCTFSRMQWLLSEASESQPPKLPDSAAADVAAILKDSSTLVVSEDGKQVRRAEVRHFFFLENLPTWIFFSNLNFSNQKSYLHLSKICV